MLAEVAATGQAVRPRRAAHVDAVLRVRRQDHRGPQGRQPQPQGRPDRRQGRGRRRRQPGGRPDRRLRRPQRVRLHHQGRRRRHGLEPHRRAQSTATPTAPSSTIRTGRSLENMDSLPFVTPVYKRDLEDRELLHRLSEAPLHLVLHRPRLQIALHLLPVAADRRRPSLPHPQRRPRDRGDRLGQEGVPAGQGILLRRRHLHRRPAARRGDRRASSASSASPGRATPRPTCRARR